MAADSTLVQAAFNLGKSRVPGDYSSIFNKQYEGLVAFQKARYEGYGDIVKGIGSSVTAINKEVKERKKADAEADNLLFKDTYETIATDVSNEKMKEAGLVFEKGSAQNTGHIDAANVRFDDLKTQLSVLSEKSFLSKAEKKEQADLRRSAEQMKKELIEAKANVTTNTAAYKEGFVNNALSFNGSPNEQLLFAQVHDPNADLEALGIRVYWDDNNELQYEYTPNRLQEEYKANERKDSQEDYSPLLEEFAPGNTLKISAKKLASMMVLKDIKANNDANALVTKSASAASEVIGKTKNLAHKDFSRISNSIYNDYKSLFLNQNTNIQDLTTREVLVGNTNRTYVNDLGSNTLIDETLINQLGIGSDEFSVDEWRDGKIDAEELKAHEGARAELIQKLTNPQTQSEREVAADELARYWTSHAKSEFDYIRTQNVSTTEVDARNNVLGTYRTWKRQDDILDLATEGKAINDWSGNKWQPDPQKPGNYKSLDGGVSLALDDLLKGPYFGMTERINQRNIEYSQKQYSEGGNGLPMVKKAPLPEREITSSNFGIKTHKKVINKLKQFYKDYPNFKFEFAAKDQLKIIAPDNKTQVVIDMDRNLYKNKESRTQIQNFITENKVKI